jgi:hypothetical protein
MPIKCSNLDLHIVSLGGYVINIKCSFI